MMGDRRPAWRLECVQRGLAGAQPHDTDLVMMPT
jgi:hypothetical protein